MQSLRVTFSNVSLPPERLSDEAFTPVGFGFTDAASKDGGAAVDCPKAAPAESIVSPTLKTVRSNSI
jgi:hypothetical protein